MSVRNYVRKVPHRTDIADSPHYVRPDNSTEAGLS
jgi:hypothetical protein